MTQKPKLYGMGKAQRVKRRRQATGKAKLRQPRAGRGRKPDGSAPRTKILNLRISEWDRLQIEAYAVTKNLTISSAAVALLRCAFRRCAEEGLTAAPPFRIEPLDTINGTSN